MRRTIALLASLMAAVLSMSAAEKMSYIFKRGDRSYIMTGNVAIHNIGSLTNRWSGDYLWARISGQEYLIRDDATMTEAREAFVQVEANQKLYHALEAKMRPVEKRHDTLEERHDDLADDLSDNPEDYTEAEERDMERRIRELEQQMRPLEQQLRELEREEEVLDQREEVLEEAAEKKLRQIIERAIARGIAERL
jgi:hypothetical protein